MIHVAHGLDELRALAGADLGPSDWLDIDQGRIDAFADATDDHQWIHVDPERARSGPFGTTIAHGYLTVALVIPLWTQLLQIEGIDMAVNYGLNRLRFPAPVPVGSAIRLRAHVAGVEEIARGVQVNVECTVEVRGGGKPALVADVLYRYYVKEAP